MNEARVGGLLPAPCGKGSPPLERTPARDPDETGYVTRDGVRLHWERYGDGERTVVLLPTWSIVHSRVWKLQIPFLSRHFRVITFDGRGNGRSDRPAGAEAYTTDEFAADAIAVMDATGTASAALWRLLLWGAVGDDHGRRDPNGSSGSPTSGPRSRSRPITSCAPIHGFDEARHGRGVGQVQQPLLAPRLRGLPLVLRGGVPRASAPPNRSRTSWVGRSRPTRRRSPTRSRVWQIGGANRWKARLANVDCPTLVIHGDDDRSDRTPRGRRCA